MRPALLATAMLLAGCSLEPNWLDGSLDTVLDLGFDQTRVRRYDSELAVEYVDSLRQGMVVIRVTVRNPGGLRNDRAYDLERRGAVGTSDEAGIQLPDLESGEIEFFQGVQGGATRGRFEARFATPDGIRLGVVGGFDADIEEVEW